jgi:hypothetical protein
LVPRTRLSTDPNLYGPITFFPERALYLLSFNNGDVGPSFLHWIVGKGNAMAARRILLSDRTNAVKGRPRLVETVHHAGRIIRIYGYPPYPAGGVNGGHVAAFVPCGNEVVLASIHGYANVYATDRIALALAEAAGCPR